MAKHFWNSTPPRLWPIVRFAAERGWGITITRPQNNRLTLHLKRDTIRDPILTAEWHFHPYGWTPGARADFRLSPGHTGRWRFYTAHVRSRADSRPVRCNLADLPKLLLEADRDPPQS